MKSCFEYVLKSLLLVFYLATYCIPRKRNLWVFGEPHGFNNNSKYFYLDVLDNHKNIKAYWIGNRAITRQLRTLGLPAYSKDSFIGIILCLFADVYIVSWSPGDINFYTSGGAKIINLWHGIGWKKCLWTEPQNVLFHSGSIIFKIKHILLKPSLHFKPTLVLSSSPFYTDNFFTKIFEVEKSKCVESQYPRCEYIVKGGDDVIKLLKRFSLSEELSIIESLSDYRKVIIYAPTFRDDNSDFLSSSGINFEQLNTFLSVSKSIFLIKLHPRTRIDRLMNSNFSNIHILNNAIDLNAIMPFCDVMISDYSSVWVDFLLLNKPIIIFPFDFDNYRKNCREMLIDYDIAIQGLPIAYNFSDLLNILNKNIPLPDPKTIKMYWNYSEDLFDRIINL